MRSIAKLLFFVLLFVLAACQQIKEEYTLSTNDGLNKISASLGASTKVSINDGSISWMSTDNIYVVEVSQDGAYSGNVFSFAIDAESISHDGKSCEFISANSLVSGRDYIAISSPYLAIENGKINLGGAMAAQSTSASYDHLEKGWIMVSNKFTASELSTPALIFTNQQSILSLELRFNDNVTVSEQLDSVVFWSQAKCFIDDVVIDVQGNVAPYSGNSSKNYSSLSIDGESIINSSHGYVANLLIFLNPEIQSKEGDFTIEIFTRSGKMATATHPARVLSSNTIYSAVVEFDSPINISDIDKSALVSIYDSMGGDNWTNNSGWKSDKPLCEWYGVECDAMGRVVSLDLFNNNLVGSIASDIANLSKLTHLNLAYNSIENQIPISICELTSLRSLMLYNTNLSGSIPSDIGKLVNLQYLHLNNNKFSGEIPASITNLTSLEILSMRNNMLSGSLPLNIGNLSNIKELDIRYNKLSGTIPPSLYANQSFWNRVAWNVVKQQTTYGFGSDFAPIYLETSNITTIENEVINMQEFFANNNLTCVVYWRTDSDMGASYMSQLKQLYQKYESYGFDIISLSDQTSLPTISEYITKNDIPGKFCIVSDDNTINYLPTQDSPTYAFVDKSGKVLYSESIHSLDPEYGRELATANFVDDYLKDIKPGEKSRDGEVIQLQKATVGRGLDFVIVGDGFAEYEMASFEKWARDALEYLFAEEPYSTFRDRFNVYMVMAVSEESGITNGNSKFGSVYNGRYILGNNELIIKYAQKVPTLIDKNYYTIINIVNAYKHGGTCYWYSNSDITVSYCGLIDGGKEFKDVIIHEACGHGFAKLADEYVTNEGFIDEDNKGTLLELHSMGRAVNVDLTNNENEIKWAYLFDDHNYTGLVGVYEGGYYFSQGVYRPSYNSIMRNHLDGFNAPSRHEIYKLIMEHSGDTYSYDKFVEYDAINRTREALTRTQAETNKVDMDKFIPNPPPVLIRNK